MAEAIILKVSPTRLAFIKFYVLAILLLLVWIVLYFQILPKQVVSAYATALKQYSTYFLALPMFGAALVLFAEIKRGVRHYYLTNERLMEKRGIFSLSETSIRLERIANYSVRQSFLGRFFNVGTIIIESVGGSEAPEIVMRGISNVSAVKKQLDTLIHRTP